MAVLNKKLDDHDSLIFPCDCGDSHYLRVEWDDEDPEWRFLWFEGVVWPRGIRQRIKWAWKSLKGDIVYNDGVILNKDTLSDLKEYIDRYQ